MSMGKIKIFLLAFVFIITFEKESLAQCTAPTGSCATNCTPMCEDFGTASTCPSNGSGTVVSNAYVVNQQLGPGSINPPGAVDDGEYMVISCQPSTWNAGWAANPVDHTTGTGDFMMVNAGAGPREFYHRNVPNLCAAATYQVSYWFANVGHYDGTATGFCSYGNPESITTYRYPSGTACSCTCTGGSTGGLL
jgi:hypothetical protein